MSKTSKSVVLLIVLLSFAGFVQGTHAEAEAVRPNFLFIVTDDQSWIHNSYAGYPAVKTPNFDRIANEGVYFRHAYASAPTCTASRSAILAGQHFWRLGSAAQLWGEFPRSLVNYQQILARNGYKIGYTGKGWGPGKSWGAGEAAVENENPVGMGFNIAAQPANEANLTPFDMTESLKRFLADRTPGQPFSFWLSPTEPHRPYRTNIGKDSGEVAMNKIELPSFLPDNDIVRSDLADYLYEIQWFDKELGRILQLLADLGVLENTVIVYTSDNGMPFARSKSNNYEYGTHVPLAVRWGEQIKKHQDINDYISLTDIAPTFLELAGIAIPAEMTGKSFQQQLTTPKAGWWDRLLGRSVWIDEQRNTVFSGFERHIGDARQENRGYPSRAVHTENYLYIRNFTPDRWPAGRPPLLADIDDGSPSKNELIEERQKYKRHIQKQTGVTPSLEDLFTLHKDANATIDLSAEPSYALVLAAAKRPGEELYDIQKDPGQLYNLAADPAYDDIKKQLATQLSDELKRTDDPWSKGEGSIFDSYKYYAPLSAN